MATLVSDLINEALNVGPSFAMDDSMNERLPHMKLSGKFALSRTIGIKKSYLDDLRLRKFGLAASFTQWKSSFCNAICHIVLIGSSEKMGRAEASSVIASVKDLMSFWNRAIAKSVCLSVNKSSNVSGPVLGITMTTYTAGPFQALISVRSLTQHCFHEVVIAGRRYHPGIMAQGAV